MYTLIRTRLYTYIRKDIHTLRKHAPTKCQPRAEDTYVYLHMYTKEETYVYLHMTFDFFLYLLCMQKYALWGGFG